ncbi:MAG: uridine kinase [Bacteroides sp.]|nr:uridine kinase [Roseburia sp.]MCM1347674.1 uridine kinase [Bacteroides sp.]MCM1422106.1 uridine kinase [Bacteroides sp.]
METIIIGVAGGTGSGKSTFTNRLKKAFGDNISVVYHDNYYKSSDGIPFEIRKNINYDHPDAFETSLLLKHLKMLKEGQAIDCPVYDYTVHNRSEQVVHVEARKVIIVEGILVLQNEELRSLFDIKVFVEADADERIMRRAIRDMRERGRDLDGIFKQYVTTVKPMHNMYVEPTKVLADIVINSAFNDVAFDIVANKITQVLTR